MKKSLINIIILALVITNVILTGIIVFAIVPGMSSTNSLVSKIASAIDIEKGEGTDTSTISIDDVEVYDLAEKFTINLKQGSDNTVHYAVTYVSLKLNKTHEDYEKYVGVLPEKESLMRAEISMTISSYTAAELNNSKTVVTNDILKKLQSMYGSEFIMDVVFRDLTVQ